MTDARDDDTRYMQRALALAERGAGQVAPNPLVGAVVVRDGTIVGEGWHARFGGDHAEVMALRAAGASARGATIYVTLEPCDHVGKTPPCTRAVRDAGVVRVVYAVPDPNPIAAGGGAHLRADGVHVTSSVCEREARDLNAVFLFAVREGSRPFVTLKLAVSIDGALVDASRARGWLTGPDARRAVHALRAQSDATAVGIGTVLSDNPALTVRDVPAPRLTPRRVVFDRRARLPLDSLLVRTAREVPVMVVTDGSRPDAETALRSAGVEVLQATTLSDALRQLRAGGVEHLLVEGGATLASAMMAAGQVDRLITFQGPVILGAGALAAFATLPSRPAETAPRFRVIARREYGADLMTSYAVSGD
ncbi:MAG: bifunctional diaminohydroxyphosphoribosylaminopyrimidine deaminase/5-amino-6-(5-phosphoribosylamino)uracil reductase RibD [Gemmatimonadaceae bacterium]|nr:bifunctional diaminohydroxyphosphoribosylaminopyrimidine deaminase/5-amino-6-(5-phosphoribosylamino)uracil reductase RibD [Gemmatimonadaceae bacterium]